METREQMEARLRMEAEIRKEIEAEQAAEAKKKKRKKTARNYFIGLGIMLLLTQGFEWVLNWLDPTIGYDIGKGFMLIIVLPAGIIAYTVAFFFVDEFYIFTRF